MPSGDSSNDSSASSRQPNPAVRRNRKTSSTGDGGLPEEQRSPHSAALKVIEPASVPLPTASASAAPATTKAADEDSLENQSKEFLVQRVQALERQLMIRNADCARLLEERKQLLPLRQKCESQREMVLALREQLDLAQAQRESANDAMEAMRRGQRDKEHRERVERAQRSMYGAKGAPQPTASSSGSVPSSAPPAARPPPVQGSRMQNTRRAPGGTVVTTAAGPQILYDTSDISSVGFSTSAKLPYDFLGGPGAQVQYLTQHRKDSQAGGGGEEPEGGLDVSEDAQVRRTMAAAMEQAQLDAKHAELEDAEHDALMARLKALRDLPKK